MHLFKINPSVLIIFISMFGWSVSVYWCTTEAAALVSILLRTHSCNSPQEWIDHIIIQMSHEILLHINPLTDLQATHQFLDVFHDNDPDARRHFWCRWSCLAKSDRLLYNSYTTPFSSRTLPQKNPVSLSSPACPVSLLLWIFNWAVLDLVGNRLRHRHSC